jgi:predicted ATPase
MKIESIRIQSFKSFADSGWVELSEHFTVLVGQNNAGKSAFLQAFDIHGIVSKPHRNPKRPVTAGAVQTQVGYQLVVPGEELNERVLNNTVFHIPTNQQIGAGAKALFLERTNKFEASLTDFNNISFPRAPGYGIIPDDKMCNLTLHLDASARQVITSTVVNYSQFMDDIGGVIQAHFRENTFIFKAERYAIGSCGMQSVSRLTPDASNLPYMLLTLNKDHKKMEDFQLLVSEVLPGVRRVLGSGPNSWLPKSV